MPENNPSPADAEEDELASFLPVLAVVRLDSVPGMATKIWDSKHPEDRLARPPVVEAPLHGSYNILFPIEFRDRGIAWLLKIPINGTPRHWNTLCADELESEARTMQLIRKHTTIPIPDVFGFCKTPDNPLRCPHIWLSFIPGISLYDFWFAECPGMSEEDYHRRRTRVLKDVASAMVQLSQFSFREGGRLTFTDGRPPSVGCRRELDIDAFAERLEQDNPDHMPVYFPSGPYKTAKEFYTNALNRQKLDSSEFLLGQRRLLQFFVDCIDDLFAADAHSFVLTHPDFDLQNFLVSPQGDLVSILDWDGVGAWPRSLGNLRYPGWLIRDWDPGVYGYGSDGVLHNPEMRGDLPQTLARYRKVYQNAIRDALGEQKIQGDSQTYHTSATLITEILHTAASNRKDRGMILRKIVQEIAGLVKVPCSDEDLLYMELCHSFGQGEPSKGALEALRTGLTMLLQNESL
ncbi:hypothetical protein QBC46DRAFT_438663 [Diplogelasinospora grovesii]|uniref:Aminoglycoside phosphotransferase domain-containing protein n=1 Tax=Diplogelasinospora grovesii TaxID=303347 RepID=A0AAN6N5Y8_9PEZI|nr:hypothetical protein QBC46DRAFT_438663 [Diplogelasinospora grovesii]